MKNTYLAKLCYRVSGKVSKIRVPRRTYAVVNWGFEEDTKTEVAFAGWALGSLGISFKLLNLSMRLDNTHWDHWALQHNYCKPTYCPDCRGYICGQDDD